VKKQQHNVLIIGAGLAGLYAALNLAPRPVTLISPKPLGFDASSAWAQGGPFDRSQDGDFLMSKEAAHSFARVVRVKGDQAGAAIMRTLVKEVLNTPSITVMQGLTALDLIVKNNEMCGVVVARWRLELVLKLLMQSLFNFIQQPWI